jgi:hypothetical protein
MNTQALLTDLTKQEEETLSGGYYTNASAFLAALTNWGWQNSKTIQTSLVNNVRQNGIGVIDRRVNAILSNLRRYW